MKKIYISLFVIFIFSLASFGQTPSPAPTATPATSDDDVVKITTTLIQLDVTVTDKNGKVVNDLKPEELEVYENDKKHNHQTK